MTEFDSIYFHEIRGVILRVFHLIQYQDTTALRHSLHDKYPRHHRLFREVPHEERFVHGHVLAADHDVVRYLINLVYQQERRTMGQQRSHLVHIHQRFCTRVDIGANILSFRLCNRLAHFFRQGCICLVSGISPR